MRKKFWSTARHQAGISGRAADLQSDQQDAGSDTIRAFLKTAGNVVDYLDVHWYWDWGKTSFDHWLDEPPSYGETINRIRSVCRESGYPGIGLVVLEWNVAPSDGSVSFSPSLFAVIQGNLLLDFLNNDVELTCLWPLLWRTSQKVWPEQDVSRALSLRCRRMSDTVG